MTHKTKLPIYMDHAAATPVAPEVRQAMAPYYSERFGNPSSLHSCGRAARAAIEQARGQVADFIHCLPEEIIFTSGGTESDNAAICGVALARKETHRHLITSAIEHHAVLESCAFLQSLGFEVTHLPVNSEGLVAPAKLAAALRPDTALISIMMANNEIGTVEPLEQLAAIARERQVPFHSDAVQAAGILKIDVQQLGVDLISLSGHKIYGPKGAGALYLRKGTPYHSFLHGGEQESRRRGGTENVPAIVGLGAACPLAAALRPTEASRLAGLRDKLIEGVLEEIPGSALTGHPEERLPGLASFIFERLDSQALLIRLDLAGIAASNGSACASGSPQPSHVLQAIGLPSEQVRSSLRLSLGRTSTEAEIDLMIGQLKGIVADIRKVGSLDLKQTRYQ